MRRADWRDYANAVGVGLLSFVLLSLSGEGQSVTMPEPTRQVTAETAYVSLSKPASMVIHRGREVILSVPELHEDAAKLGANGVWVINPSSGTPAWIGNLGSMIGTDMTTAFFAGHNVYGDIPMPFYLLGSVRPGDMIEVTLQSGRAVTFEATPEGVDDQPKGVIEEQVRRKVIKLTSCTPDGKGTVSITAEAVSF